MTTQRFYNPNWINDDDLVAGFIARRALFTFLRDELKRMPRHGSVQHFLLVGPRGSGKTTLLKRLAVALRRDEDLTDHLIPLSFQEELYQIKGLSDFWWAACDALLDELERTGQNADADRLTDAIDARKRGNPGLPTNLHDDVGLRLLLRICAELQRRPVLLVDNLDMVMQRLDTRGRKRNDPLSPTYWALREALSTADAPIMIGGSVRVSEPFSGYDKAFYDFFATKRMPKLSLEEVEDVLRHLAIDHGMGDWDQRVRGGRGRIKALYEMTGGNPRALGLIFDLLRQGATGRAIDDFERLLDLTTPYYKARMEDLSEQAQVIVHAMAQLRRRVPAADIAREAGLETRTVSAQLELLVNEGVVEKTPGKKTHYIVAEQLFRIWLQMRSSRRLRQRVQYLTEFLEAWFDQEELGALLTTDNRLPSRPRAAALRDFAMAEWQGDQTAIGRALKARAADGLLCDPDGLSPPAAPGDFAPDLEALTKCSDQLRANKKHLGSLDPKLLLGSLSLNVQERCDRANRLCDPATSEAEQKRLESLFADERDRLQRAGLSAADIDLLYELRSRDLWRLPNLTVAEVDATVKTTQAQPARLHRLAWRLLGSRLIKASSATEAQDWITFGRNCAPELNTDNWAAVAWALRLDGFIDAAADAVKEAFLHGPSARAWFERGNLLIHDKHFKEAKAAFCKAIALDPSRAILWCRLAGVLDDHLGQYDAAEAAFRKAIDLAPSDHWAWRDLGDLLADHFGRYEEAETAFRKAIEHNPSTSLLWTRLGQLLSNHLGHFDKAGVAFRKAIELDPSDFLPWVCLGHLSVYHLQRYEAAEGAFRKAIKLSPSTEWLWTCLATLLTNHLERHKEAECFLQKSIALYPSKAFSWSEIASAMCKSSRSIDKINEAESAFFRSYIIDPSNEWQFNAWKSLEYLRASLPICEAIAAENWGIAREQLEKVVANSKSEPDLWASEAMIDVVVGGALQLGQGERLLRLLCELGVDRLAAPLVMALEAAVAGSPESLANVEPEARGAAESLYARLTRKAEEEGALKN
ncbi:tetratricopeptide repeat protein [Azospirillum griseum]|uniref:Tetratricopeptide repeat protein n=1 Tax=Azospirillum griseum TaxID=2496639 RepID=A0A3S0JKR8_9PROT|nr:tetratricopeptide repeat protein [Azospirillum griseum]RTR22959.1 tetratricopeptide repeat protein [Azospirillum griseum]